MSKRKRVFGRAEEMQQVAQVLRQNNLPEPAVKRALLALCGVEVRMEFHPLGGFFGGGEMPPILGASG